MAVLEIECVSCHVCPWSGTRPALKASQLELKDGEGSVLETNGHSGSGPDVYSASNRKISFDTVVGACGDISTRVPDTLEKRPGVQAKGNQKSTSQGNGLIIPVSCSGCLLAFRHGDSMALEIDDRSAKIFPVQVGAAGTAWLPARPLRSSSSVCMKDPAAAEAWTHVLQSTIAPSGGCACADQQQCQPQGQQHVMMRLTSQIGSFTALRDCHADMPEDLRWASALLAACRLSVKHMPSRKLRNVMSFPGNDTVIVGTVHGRFGSPSMKLTSFVGEAALIERGKTKDSLLPCFCTGLTRQVEVRLGSSLSTNLLPGSAPPADSALGPMLSLLSRNRPGPTLFICWLELGDLMLR